MDATTAAVSAVSPVAPSTVVVAACCFCYHSTAVEKVAVAVVGIALVDGQVFVRVIVSPTAFIIVVAASTKLHFSFDNSVPWVNSVPALRLLSHWR